MKTFFLVAGIVFSIGPFFSISDKLESYPVQQYGQVVEMRIIDSPSSCLGTKQKYFMKVKYGKMIFLKSIGGSYCESHFVDDVVQLKYLPGENNVLFPDEGVIGEFIAMAVLVLVGVYCVFTGLKKDTN